MDRYQPFLSRRALLFCALPLCNIVQLCSVIRYAGDAASLSVQKINVAAIETYLPGMIVNPNHIVQLILVNITIRYAHICTSVVGTIISNPIIAQNASKCNLLFGVHFFAGSDFTSSALTGVRHLHHFKTTAVEAAKETY